MSFLPADAADPWPNTAANRWQALALIETLNADILGSRSATLTLEAWCGTHHLAETQQVVADLIADTPARPPTAEQRQRLAVGADDPVAYRRVRLRCGNRILSEADNWYVPARLTPEMNRALTTTDAPFGKVVRPLQPYRMTFEVRLLWSPLATPADLASIPIPQQLFEHRAILYTRDHLPFSEVDEVYQRDTLDFRPSD